MARIDYIKSMELTNNTSNIKNKSITGRTFVADYGNNYWTIKIETVPLTQQQFLNEFLGGFFYVASNKVEKITTDFKLPVLKDKRGTASGTITVLNENSTAPAYNKDIGSNTVGVSGGTGTLLAGDLIKFSGHSKVYMITAATNLDGSTKDTISFTPRLVSGVATNTITYSDVTFTVIPETDVEEWRLAGASNGALQSPTGVNTNETQALFEYEQTYREVVR